ncbi:hypothetical protein DIPPA_21231 [Diplonema papillatum]|nr:hypothetical protein DIPPA_21231 [Diplonema papillatum]|eukprot:gene5244-8004_t
MLPTIAALAAVATVTYDMAGFGYANDTQQIASEACYASYISSVNGGESHIGLQTASSFDELQTSIRREVKVGFGVGVFKIGAEASYLRSVMDTEYSMSLNYYQYSSARVNVQLNGTSDNALSSFGGQMYGNGSNPNFRVVCGDNYLTSYEGGALLLMAINVVLADGEQKTVFSESVTGVEDIVTATAAVQKISEEKHLTGKVVMGAYQIGGSPNNLTQILSKDPAGNYYVLECQFTDMTACQDAANGLLNYATTDFSTQFNFNTAEGLAFLGDGFYTYQPASYVGVATTPTWVTADVTQARQSLAAALAEAEYYAQNFYPLYSSYAVPWNESSDLYATIKSGYVTSVANVASVLSYSNPEKGALGCFDTPDLCVDLAQSITSSLKNVSAAVEAVQQVQLVLPFGAAENNNFVELVWDGGAYRAHELPPATNGDAFKSIHSFSVSPTRLTYDAQYTSGKDTVQVKYNGTSTDGSHYNGTACHGTPGKSLSDCGILVAGWTQSPYFFTAYSH